MILLTGGREKKYITFWSKLPDGKITSGTFIAEKISVTF